MIDKGDCFTGLQSFLSHAAKAFGLDESSPEPFILPDDWIRMGIAACGAGRLDRAVACKRAADILLTGYGSSADEIGERLGPLQHAIGGMQKLNCSPGAT